MLKGFKEFVLRGNVVELGVAFVIGTAFAALVDTFVASIIDPILAVITPGEKAFGFRIVSDNPATFINVGGIVTAIVVFLLTAALIYFLLVAPMNKVKEIRAARAEAGVEPEEPTDTELLTEIRDLLKK